MDRYDRSYYPGHDEIDYSSYETTEIGRLKRFSRNTTEITHFEDFENDLQKFTMDLRYNFVFSINFNDHLW